MSVNLQREWKKRIAFGESKWDCTNPPSSGTSRNSTSGDVVSGKDSGAVAKDWNGQKLKEEVTAQAQITQAFSSMAAKDIGTYAGRC
jgi:hypothetical protein